MRESSHAPPEKGLTTDINLSLSSKIWWNAMWIYTNNPWARTGFVCWQRKKADLHGLWGLTCFHHVCLVEGDVGDFIAIRFEFLLGIVRNFGLTASATTNRWPPGLEEKQIDPSKSKKKEEGLDWWRNIIRCQIFSVQNHCIIIILDEESNRRGDCLVTFPLCSSCALVGALWLLSLLRKRTKRPTRWKKKKQKTRNALGCTGGCCVGLTATGELRVAVLPRAAEKKEIQS